MGDNTKTRQETCRVFALKAIKLSSASAVLALREAILAIDWTIAGRLEWNFTFFLTFRACGLVEFPRTSTTKPASSATVIKTHNLSFIVIINQSFTRKTAWLIFG